MNLSGEVMAVIGALAGAISTVTGVFYRDLLKQRDECCRERDRLRTDAAALLESYRKRDDEELRLLREERWRSERNGPDAPGQAGRARAGRT